MWSLVQCDKTHTTAKFKGAESNQNVQIFDVLTAVVAEDAGLPK